MLRQLQMGALALFVLFAGLTILCQLRCGMLGGKIERGEASPEELDRMRAQAKWFAAAAAVSLAVCIAIGAAALR